MMGATLYGVWGAGGCGRGILPLFRDWLKGQQNSELVFVDDAPTDDIRNCGLYEILTFSDYLQRSEETKKMAIAIANSSIREELFNRCIKNNIQIAGMRAPSVIQMDDVTIGAGALLSPYVTLTSNIRIGKCFHANLYSYIEHDCVIGDFVTLAPRVSINGNVVVQDHAYIGAGAVIKQGTPTTPLIIGRGAIIGMGAVVTKSVPAGAVVVGNPARAMR
jgi:sugar O-acyltransferase (sialic acid O-acetyltransferase NeuD family)